MLLTFLNLTKESLVITNLNPKSNKIQEGFEETEKRIQDLGELVRYKNYTSFTPAFFENSVEVLNFGLNAAEFKLVLWLVVLLLIVEFFIEKNEEIIIKLWKKMPSLIRLSFYLLIVLIIIYYGQYGNGNENSFIYFQF